MEEEKVMMSCDGGDSREAPWVLLGLRPASSVIVEPHQTSPSRHGKKREEGHERDSIHYPRATSKKEGHLGMTN